MRSVMRRRIYFIVSLILLISILVFIVWNLFLPDILDLDIKHISDPVKEEIYKQATFWVLVSLFVITILIYIFDKMITNED